MILNEKQQELIMNRKRFHNESYQAYKENLKTEEDTRKKSLAGRMAWPASFGTARRFNEGDKRFYRNKNYSVRIAK